MTTQKISGGKFHQLPADLRKALESSRKALLAWEDITPLARNEWICWVITVQQAETRRDHIKRTVAELKEGKRRPCCWLGCTHRTDKKLSPSAQWVLMRRSRSLR
jgi:uncharacterized protein YdeI (YjbR/CyaY-like superfamily)